MSFEITYLGASGGPIEANTCSLIIKPANMEYSQILNSNTSPLLMIDAGAGYLLLAEIISNEDDAPNKLLRLYSDSNSVSSYISAKRSYPFRSLKSSPLPSLKKIISSIPTLLITHPHLDHILALVLNSAEPTPKNPSHKIYASEFTVDSIQNYIFNWKIWPDMHNLGQLNLHPIKPFSSFSTNDNLYTVTAFDLQHGTIPIVTGPSLIHLPRVPYHSLAYLITHNPTQAKLLSFGDFEADQILGKLLNRNIWKSVSPFVDDGSLKAIILECSTPTRAPNTSLYGHLMPVHVVDELMELRSFCSNPAALSEIHIIITHVKENLEGTDPRKIILRELHEICAERGLRVKLTIALGGILLVV